MISLAAVMSNPALARDAPQRRPAQADHDLPQGPVVHVQGAFPGHAAGVERRVAEVQAIVDRGGQQVVRGGDRVEIARELQVDRVGRLQPATPRRRSPPLAAEDRTHRGLPQGQARRLADPVQSLGQSDRRGRLPLAGRGGRDGRHEDELARGPIARGDGLQTGPWPCRGRRVRGTRRRSRGRGPRRRWAGGRGGASCGISSVVGHVPIVIGRVSRRRHRSPGGPGGRSAPVATPGGAWSGGADGQGTAHTSTCSESSRSDRPIGRCVEARTRGSSSFPAAPGPLDDLVVEVREPIRHDVHDDQPDPLLEVAEALSRRTLDGIRAGPCCRGRPARRPPRGRPASSRDQDLHAPGRPSARPRRRGATQADGGDGHGHPASLRRPRSASRSNVATSISTRLPTWIWAAAGISSRADAPRSARP